MQHELRLGKLFLSHSKGVPEDTSWKAAMFHVCIDLDDEDGDPSGLYMHFLGRTIQCYYPLHIKYAMVYEWGGRLIQARW